MSGRLMRTPAPARPGLDALFEAARNHVWQPGEMAAQRKSWVVGEMMLSHPEMTREEAARIYDEVTSETPTARVRPAPDEVQG